MGSHSASHPQLLLGVDVGGTFTDAVLVGKGQTWSAKRPTTPHDQSIGAMSAVEAVLAQAGAGAADVARFAHGTTVATNAVLERRLASTALVTTRGFGDMLVIARQDRPHPFDLDVHPTRPLVPRARVVEVDERMTPAGVERALAAAAIDDTVDALRRLPDLEAVAICLLHGWAHPDHEAALARAVRRELPGLHVVASHELSREIREYERACTTVLDAALAPVVAPYLERLAARAAAAGLPTPFVMQSNGGLGSLVAVANHPARAVLSGPAGGIVLAQEIRETRERDLIACIDVGGTSSDVALVAATSGRAAERRIAGLPIQLDMLDIHTVGAGGSSIVTVGPAGVVVGPDSAGAVPGPAAWGRGGDQLTLTDCHLLRGDIGPDTLAHWGIQLDIHAARDALLRTIGVDPADETLRCDPATIKQADVVLHEAVAVAAEHMAEAVRAVTVARGEDPARLALLAYGGAGGLYACAVADSIGCRSVLAPLHGGVVSAHGLAIADERTSASRSVLLRTTDEGTPAWSEALAWCAGADAVDADCRFVGQTHTVRVPFAGDVDRLADEFRAAHVERFGFEDPDSDVEVVTLHLSSIVELDHSRRPHPKLIEDVGEARRTACGGSAYDLPDGTLLVPAGWAITRRHPDLLELERSAPPTGTAELATSVLERRLAGVCEEMGAALVHAARSPNITERRDSSCAVFTAGGELVAQAAHVPVHLGSMKDAARAVLDAGASPGETWIVNDPYAGGTHLPDITLLRMLPDPTRPGSPLAIAAARAHHADVGGIHPGSMSPFCSTIDEEGIRIEPRRCSRGDAADLVAGMRGTADRMGDLAAQFAALDVAERRLTTIARGGLDLGAALESLVLVGARRGRAVLAPHEGVRASASRPVELPDGTTSCIVADVRVADGRLVVDLTGSSNQAPGSLNCPAAVSRAAASTALRACLAPDLPAAACGDEVLEVVTRPGTLVHATYPAAVAGGNVEVSSACFDAVAAAIGEAVGAPRADGQGTMNNLALGDPEGSWTWYETIAGGQGASANGPGAHAVHVAMTNTRSTPAEVLEATLPVRVEEHAVRLGSGGDGVHRGGDGVRRRLRLLAPASASLLCQRRASGARGAEGGADGAPGDNRVDGARVGAAFERDLEAGTVIEIETPGGGGWGASAPVMPRQ